jgi:hypothetical protein
MRYGFPMVPRTGSPADPKTNQVVAAIEVGKRPCSGPAAGFGSVWAPVCGDRPGVENGARPRWRGSTSDEPGDRHDSGGARKQ